MKERRKGKTETSGEHVPTMETVALSLGGGAGRRKKAAFRREGVRAGTSVEKPHLIHRLQALWEPPRGALEGKTAAKGVH